MDAQQIKPFIDAMAASDLAEMEFSRDGWTLKLVRRPGAAAPTAIAPEAAATAVPAPVARSPVTPKELLSPLYGVVHLQSAPGEAPFVKPGQSVRAGQTLCVIEAMKVFNEVQAEHEGVVDALLVESGQEVEAGQALLRFR